jgi:hypothetical protein
LDKRAAAEEGALRDVDFQFEKSLVRKQASYFVTKAMKSRDFNSIKCMCTNKYTNSCEPQRSLFVTGKADLNHRCGLELLLYGRDHMHHLRQSFAGLNSPDFTISECHVGIFPVESDCYQQIYQQNRSDTNTPSRTASDEDSE